MKLLYISSPFSAPTEIEIQKNILAADELGIKAIEAGWYPIIPHKNTAGYQHLGKPNDFWYEMDLEILSKCDAMIENIQDTVPWFDSKGMRIESDYAIQKKIPTLQIFHPHQESDDEIKFTWGIGGQWVRMDHFPTPEEVFGKGKELTSENNPEGFVQK